MNNLKIIDGRIQCFKRLQDLFLDTGGGDISIDGANGTGKTSTADAWFWLCIGKDSRGRADFALMPLDDDGNPVPDAETVVEMSVLHNDQPITLIKKCKASKSGGHTTKYWINDVVPKKATEFKAFVDSIIGDEETYRLLSDPLFFGLMPWQRRREILIDIAGDVTDAEVFAADPELSGIADILEEDVK